MPRRKDPSEIVALMKNPASVRNFGLIGHIDHGKTTLSDSLLSEAGLLSPELAGEARALDFLEEEQKRGITMKSANISLYYEKAGEKNEPFVINLVDTPGHLDFSGKVTRALRLVDGVVVVVDAVEEIISQSETVIRQALEERVKPVLFINKVDRLIRELNLTDDKIRKKYTRIINDFNTLIEHFAESPFKQAWKVSPADGTVAFGSALHKWGFTLNMLNKSTLKFKDIRERYEKDTISERKFEDLTVYFPIHEAILEMVVNHLPDPRTAQQYRIEKIWEGNKNSEIARAMKSCDPGSPLVICLSKVQAEKHGLIATGRIFSGTCTEKKEIFLMRENAIETIQKIALFMGQRRQRVKQLPAGNIVAIEGLKNVKSGETIIEPSIMNEMVPFENVKYVTTPVVTVSIEPEYLREIESMKEIIEHLLIEDPNLKFEINEENGEFLLSGMGPLHLEITAKEIEKRGVKVSISEPRPVFKESCKNKSSLIEIHSANGQNFIKLQIERLDDKTVKFLQTTTIESIKPLDHLKSILKMNTGLTEEEIQDFWQCDEDYNILFFKNQKELNPLIKENILTIVEKIHMNGPLAGEKLTQIKIKIMDLILNDIDEERLFTELSALLYDGIKQGLKESEMILIEPIYKTIIQVPPEYIKNTLTILSKYGAKIKAINQEKEYQATIETLLPVRKSIKFVEDIRSSTSGRAFWQNEFHSFMEVPPHEAQEIISDLRFKKGLSW